MKIVISVTGGPHQGQSYSFEGHEMFLVGRSKHAHFRLPQKDEFFSRIHFFVEVNPPRCRLTDMGSTNGTLVNGQRVSQIDLKDGDLIEGGLTRMSVSIFGGTEAERTALTVAPDQASLECGPSSATASLVLPPLPAGPWDSACALCTAPGPTPKPGVGLAWPVCSACHARIHQQPQPFPGYLLVRQIGEGGMGVVYLALSVADGRRVALKTLRPAVAAGQIELGRFLREVAILGKLRHSNIVNLIASGESAGELYFVMDFVEGVDGAKLLKAHSPLPVQRAVGIVCQLLDALGHAHAEGFVHRDIKPGNLVVCEADGKDTVKVLDFGLARVYQCSKLSGLTMIGAVGGSAPYMAPEQITDFRGAKPTVDQYAAAATLYHLLTGNHTHDFPRDFQGCLFMLLTEPHMSLQTRRPDIPDALAATIDRALAKDPGARFADVNALRKALERFA